MHFEHLGINVPDPVAMADWYVEHLGMSIVVKGEKFGARFVADDTGRLVFELYHNPAAPVLDYANQAPVTMHLAVAVEDADAERDRLVAAGATVFLEERPPDGSLLYMLRDPWGIPLQLCQRAKPMPR